MGASGAKIAIAMAFPLAIYACGLDDTVIVATRDVNGADGGGADATTNAGDASTTDSGGGTDSGSDGSVVAGPLVYGVSLTDLYSLDVTSLLLTKLHALASCNDFVIDIAVDASGNLVAITQNGGNRDVDALSLMGLCSADHRGDSSHMLSIGYFGTSLAQLFELRDDDTALELLDPASGNDSSVDDNALPGNALTDIACSSSKCYVTVDHRHCTPDPGPMGTCLWSIQSDGTGGAQVGPLSIGGVGGLAYHGGILFLFSASDSTVYQLTTSTTPTATPLALHGDTPPSSWLGAGSSSAYP